MTGQLSADDANKTLVSWVTLKDKGVRAGSVLTIQDGDRFDGIIFAERAAGKWMAGSNFFSRTEKDQNANPVESADDKTLVQMAIVYHGSRVSIYRNGELYASYDAQNIDLLSSKSNFSVIGRRHVGAGDNGSVSASIEDARIYDQALSVEQLKALKPNVASDLKPYAWWDFEGESPTERTGRYKFNTLEQGATLSDGKLILAQNGVFLSSRTEMSFIKKFAPFTPQMPDPVPATWLTYHLAHPGPDRAIPGDPNCAIFYKGRYHLFYICQSHGHSFAHVSSTDMVHWKWHETTLTPPRTGHGMFSGTAFLTKSGTPAIIYHGQGSNRNQIAFAEDDNLDKWTQPIPVEPMTPDGEPAKMRHWDPDCWLRNGTYYALGGGSNPTLAKSADLKTWEFLGELYHPEFPSDLGVAKGEDTSCANMFQLGDKWMLLCISHGLGCRYYLGDFKDGQYLPSHHAMMSWARWDFFAPESLLTPDGRRVMWAWCTPWVNGMQKVGRAKSFDALMKGRIQAGIQSLPRELSLAKDGKLRIRPLRELQELRSDERQEDDITVKSGDSYVLKDVTGDALELEIVFDAPAASEFGVNVLCGQDGSGGFTIASGSGKEKLTVGYAEPPFKLEKGEDFTLRVFIDKSMIEVFADDRQAAVAWHEYDPAKLNISLFAKGGDLRVKSVKAWTMQSIYAN
jgi:sucrose-6-phosphate hydrolase SacC (GH32 family)